MNCNRRGRECLWVSECESVNFLFRRENPTNSPNVNKTIKESVNNLHSSEKICFSMSSLEGLDDCEKKNEPAVNNFELENIEV
jgi:hypothetical protein